jgi:hypothetical protein
MAALEEVRGRVAINHNQDLKRLVGFDTLEKTGAGFEVRSVLERCLFCRRLIVELFLAYWLL